MLSTYGLPKEYGNIFSLKAHNKYTSKPKDTPFSLVQIHKSIGLQHQLSILKTWRHFVIL